MNVLFITELTPFPPNRGERIRSYNLIHSILEFADRLYLMSGEAPPDTEQYHNVTFKRFPDIYSGNRWKDLLLLFNRQKGVVRSLEAFTEVNQVDLVFLDYGFMGHYIRIFKNRGIRVVYGTHNVQSRLFYQKPIKSLSGLIYKNIRFLMEAVHERIYFRSADALLAVSEEDMDFYRHKLKHPNPVLIPNYISEKEYLDDQVDTKKNQVIMTGNFNAFQNSLGLRWFLEKVWNEQLAGLSNFIIVGHGSREHFERIKQDGVYMENVSALGPVENIKGYIAESRAAIIPLNHGSGTRLKCIEAMALKTSIISTSIGVEGIKHNGTILTADNASEFRDNLLQVLNDEIHNEEEAYQIFLQNYSSMSITPKIKEILQSK